MAMRMDVSKTKCLHPYTTTPRINGEIQQRLSVYRVTETQCVATVNELAERMLHVHCAMPISAEIVIFSNPNRDMDISKWPVVE
jgi:hypothetical protein